MKNIINCVAFKSFPSKPNNFESDNLFDEFQLYLFQNVCISNIIRPECYEYMPSYIITLSHHKTGHNLCNTLFKRVITKFCNFKNDKNLHTYWNPWYLILFKTKFMINNTKTLKIRI